MAGIHINPKTSEQHSDGAVLEAHTDCDILRTHTQYEFQPCDCEVNYDGWREADSCLRHYEEAIYKYKFVRLSNKDVMRINQWDGGFDMINETPNEKGEYIFVDQHLSILRKHKVKGRAGHRIFGRAGREFWYGGSKREDMNILNGVWDIIEDRTELRRTNFQKTRFQHAKFRKQLIISVDDFDQNCKECLMESDFIEESDGRQYKTNDRSFLVPWRYILELPGSVIDRVDDPFTALDIRDHWQWIVQDIAISEIGSMYDLKRFTS